MKFKMFFSLVAIVCSSSVAYAQGSTSQLCASPYKLICEANKEMLKARQARIDKIKAEIAAEAKPLADAEIAKLPPLANTPFGLLGRLKRWVKVQEIQNRAIIEVAGRKLGPMEAEVITKESIDNIKSLLKDAIENSKFERYLKDNFKAIVEGVQVGNFNEYAERVGLKNGFLAQLFSAHCGMDGLIDNAFATKSGGQDYVLICPGWQISLKLDEKSNGNNENRKLAGILQVLAHEIAHHIDSSDFASSYQSFNNCVAQNHSVALKSDHATEELCKQKPAECDLEKAKKHSGEIIADTWAAEVMQLYMEGSNLLMNEKEETLTMAFVRLCESRDEGIHPNDHFRLERILINNPEIRTQLNCQDKPSVAAFCAF